MTHTNALGQPIGAPMDGWTAPPRPAREAIEGRWIRLEPLSAARHGDDLWEAFSADPDGADWTWRMQEPFADRDALITWLRAIEADPEMLYFAYVDRESGRALGNGALMSIAEEAGSIEVGSIIFARALQRTRAATEAMYLKMNWAFGARYRRYE